MYSAAHGISSYYFLLGLLSDSLSWGFVIPNKKLGETYLIKCLTKVFVFYVISTCTRVTLHALSDATAYPNRGPLL